MDANKLMDLNTRLGYKEEITLSRDEFNSLLEDKTDEKDDAEQHVEDLSGENSILQIEVDSLESHVEELESEKGNLEEQVKDLKAELKEKNDE